MNKKVEIFDTSLRDWFQGSKKIAKVDDKIKISKALDEFWVDSIEVWFARASSDDFEAINKVSKMVNARVYSLARANIEDINQAYESLKDGNNYWIHTFIWTSPSHREKLWKNEEQILESVKKYVWYTNDLLKWKWRLMFSPEDALRTERDFLFKVIETAKNYWAEIINIPDTVWFAQPEQIKEIITESRKIVWDNVDLSIHAHNDLWNASTNSLAALLAWANMIQWTFPPLFWERAWNTDLVQVITNLIKCRDYFQLDLNDKIVLENIYPLVTRISEIVWERIPEKFPIIWRWVHTHWSWIHQDWVNKRSDTYEILSPEEIWLVREQSFFLTNLSWRAWLKNAIKKYFLIDLEEEKLDLFYDKFMELTKTKDYIEMDNIRELLNSNWFKIKRYVNLDDYNVTLTWKEKILAESIFYSKNSENHIKEYWVWPVDAIFKTIKKKYDLENEVELIDFTIDALWKKTEALSKVYMKLKIWDIVYEEESINKDIVKASINAYLNWLDRIIRDKNNKNSLQNW